MAGNGSTPIFKARCSKCYAKRKVWEHHRISSAEFVRKTPSSVILRCSICGHEWRSKSKAGFRLARHAEKQGV